MNSDAVEVGIAKAVLNHIASARLSQEFTPERSYADWDLKQEQQDDLALSDADKLHVDVVVRTTEKRTELSARGKVKFIVPVAVGIRRKFGADKQNDDTGRIAIEEIDKLCFLTQEIFMLFTPVALLEFPAAWDEENGGSQILVCPNKTHLRDIRQFTSIVTVTFCHHIDA